MQILRGRLIGNRLDAPFFQAAFGISAYTGYTPHIIAVRNPPDEMTLRTATRAFNSGAVGADEIRFHQRNFLFEMKERVLDVINHLHHMTYFDECHTPPETITPLGRAGFVSHIGVVIKPEDASILQSALKHCAVRPFQHADLMRLKL